MTPTDIRFITTLIQKHMTLLGTTAALSRARAVPGLTIAENGDVLHIIRNPSLIGAELENTYAALAGTASRIISRDVKKEYLLSAR